ncbi:MAG: hypothetical protein ACPG49_00285 [Chitinophagales bacterium]
MFKIKLITVFASFLCFTSMLLAQNCNTLFLEYYKNGDAPRAITNFEAFCEGVKEAETTQDFSVKWNVNERYDIRSCIRYGFEIHGVDIIAAGGTKDAKELDAIEGYNFVMNKRIKAKLGEDFNDLGVVSPKFFGPEDIFTEQFYDTFNNRLKIEKGEKGFIKLTLAKDDRFHDYMNVIMVKDRRSETQFRFSDLYNGVLVPMTEEDENGKNKLFNFSLKNFTHPHYCSAKDAPDAFVVWVKLKEFLGK